MVGCYSEPQRISLKGTFLPGASGAPQPRATSGLPKKESPLTGALEMLLCGQAQASRTNIREVSPAQDNAL